jgi:hypothetical protein
VVQDFLEDGNLMPGIHEYTCKEFEEQFVQNFPHSESRPDIYEKFCIWIRKLVKMLPPRYIWLDGSFLTTKLNPNDIDLVVFYRPEDIESKEVSEVLDNYIHQISRQYRCDAYFCLTLEHYPPEVKARISGNVAIMQTYWMGQFGFDRNRKPKGIVEIRCEELMKLGGVTHDVASRLDG